MSRPSDGNGCGGPRPKLLFHVSHFLRGGIESTLVEWLWLLAPHYEITLSVLLRTGEFEYHRGRLPAEVRVRFLLTEPWLLRTCLAKMADRRLGPLDKLVEEVAVPQLRKAIARRRLTGEVVGAAAAIDRDPGAGRFMRHASPSLAGCFRLDIEPLPPGDASAFAAAPARLPVAVQGRAERERRARKRAPFCGAAGAARRFAALPGEVGAPPPAGLAR